MRGPHLVVQLQALLCGGDGSQDGLSRRRRQRRSATQEKENPGWAVGHAVCALTCRFTLFLMLDAVPNSLASIAATLDTWPRSTSCASQLARREPQRQRAGEVQLRTYLVPGVHDERNHGRAVAPRSLQASDQLWHNKQAPGCVSTAGERGDDAGTERRERRLANAAGSRLGSRPRRRQPGRGRE